LHDISSRNTPLPPRDPIGGVVYLQIVLSLEESSRVYDISVFGKRLSRKIYNMVVIEGKIKGQIEVKRRRERRRKKLLDDLKDRRG
jgi:hypothetical protein